MLSAISVAVQIENFQETLGIGLERPRFSWKIYSDLKNWRQAAYEIICTRHDGSIKGETGRIKSSRSQYVDWPFEPLQSRERFSVRVRVWGEDGSESDWSEPVSVEAGLLNPTDWHAGFITPAFNQTHLQENQPALLRREFKTSGGVLSARLYITALGVYEVFLNGRQVGDHVLAPGWTVYHDRLLYQTFDVTDLLQPGLNGIGAIVADGWYRGRLGFGEGEVNIYGEHLGLLAQLEITYSDQSGERVVTDGAWRAATGGIVQSGIYDGETSDARLEPQGWSQPRFDDSSWSPVRPIQYDLGNLEAPLGPPIRRTESLNPSAIFQSPSGKTLVDFGQNLVGRLKIQVQGEAGHTVTLRHAEVLEHGELGTRPLRFAAQTDRYTLRGEGIESWEPKFTFHGFRYVEITNWPGELRLEDLQSIVLHSDMERIGWFESSNRLLNQLHKNVVWSMRGNFFGIPTDCPQRDERLGWTGDIQVFAPAATFLYDVKGFLHSWLIDLTLEQKKHHGAVPHVVPDILHHSGAAAWGDAAVIVPWTLYQRYGDKEILADQFQSMCDWVDYVAREAGDSYLWDNGFQFGDWLDPTAPSDKPWQARTDQGLVASAYFCYSAKLVSQIAEILNNETYRAHYADLADKAKVAFIKEYMTPAGRLMSDSETTYALAIAFDLFESEEQRMRGGNRLAELVRESGYRIRTGFVGTPLICDALALTGHHLSAFRLLTQQSCPSWLYPVTMGATTIWERWDSMLPDGSINPGEMTSFNHYALGAVADWMHRTIGGISPAEPGYRKLNIKPRPGGGLTHCSTKLQTRYGLAACSWNISAGQITMEVTVPPNTSATVVIPGRTMGKIEVGSGTWEWTADYVDPDKRGPYTVDDVLSEIVLLEGGLETICKVLEEVEAPSFLQHVVASQPNLSIRQLIEMIPDQGHLAFDKMAKALKQL